MKENQRRHRGKLLAFAALSLIALVTVFGYLGVFLHHGHGPERIEKIMNRVVEDLADELELRPEQRPAFGALTDGIKERVRNRISQMRQTAGRLRDEFAAETPDQDRFAALLKEHARNRMTVEELEGLIDDIVAFYRTLDPEQQAKINEEASEHLERHL